MLLPRKHAERPTTGFSAYHFAARRFRLLTHEASVTSLDESMQLRRALSREANARPLVTDDSSTYALIFQSRAHYSYLRRHFSRPLSDIRVIFSVLRYFVDTHIT